MFCLQMLCLHTQNANLAAPPPLVRQAPLLPTKAAELGGRHTSKDHTQDKYKCWLEEYDPGLVDGTRVTPAASNRRRCLLRWF